MKILHIEFTEEEVQEWCEYINLWIPVKQTPQSVKETIEMFPDDGGKWIVESSRDIGFETGEREVFMELWALRHTGMRWPKYGDEPEYHEEFNKRMKESKEIEEAIKEEVEKLQN